MAGECSLITVLSQRTLKYALQRLNRLGWKFPLPRRHYFAFGANLDPAFLERRGIYPVTSFPAYLSNFKISITSPCEYVGKGFASLEPQLDSLVYGVVHDISALEALILDVMEWVPFKFHRRVHGTVRTQDDDVKVFYYVSCNPKAGLKTSVAYRDLLVSGAERFAFPNDYIEHLKMLPVAEKFEIDHGFCLSNPSRRRWREHDLKALYRVHDLARERLCRVLP